MRNPFDFISRQWQSWGFGVQSPWAYSFVKEVIKERLPYYDYYLIDRKFLNEDDRKRQKLYLRLRNRYPKCRFYSLKGDSKTNHELINNEDICFDEVFVLEGIRDNKLLYEKWLTIRDENAIGITFDLYDIAICFPANDKFKQHYKLNY